LSAADSQPAVLVDDLVVRFEEVEAVGGSPSRSLASVRYVP